MTEPSELELRLKRAERRIDTLEEALDAKPRAPAWKRLFGLDSLRNLIFLIGVPVAVVAGYEKFDREIWNRQTYADLEARAEALEKIGELQRINADIYVLQARNEDNVAFAKLDAARGQYRRLTDELYRAWSDQPDVFETYEKYALAEALNTKGDNDRALDVVDTVSPDRLDTVERADLSLMKARFRFSEGPAYDIEAARAHIREAGRIAGTLESEGRMNRMYEKILSVRALNEAFRGVDCDKVVPMRDGLSDLIALTAGLDPATDPVRANTLDVIAVIDARCGG